MERGHHTVQSIPADQVQDLMLASAERTIQKEGINFRSLSYVAPELHGWAGQSVEVRYMPHDDRTIDVFLGGKHLCNAYPTGQLTPEQTEAFRAHGHAEA